MSKARELAELGDTLTVDGSGNIDITGTVTADGLTVDGDIVQAGGDELQNSGTLRLHGDYDASGAGNVEFKTKGILRQQIANGGSISFFEDTGTTPKFFWDASAQSLNVDGPITADGLTVEAAVKPVLRLSGNGNDAANTNYGEIQFYNNDTSSDGPNIGASIHVESESSTGAGGNLFLSTEQVFGSGEGTLPRKRLKVSDIGDISFYEDTGTTAKFFWDASVESLGIGTTTPSADLTLGGNGPSNRTFQMGSAGATRFVVSTDGVNGVTSIGCTNDSTTGRLTFKTGAALTERMRIDENGNVGIGTAVPSQKLDVSGNARLVGSDPYLQILRTSDFYYGKVSADGFAAFTNTNGPAPVIFKTATSERMRIDASGSVGIGTSGSTNAQLTVSRIQPDTTWGTGAHIFLKASQTVDTTGFTGISYASSVVANYGWSVGAVRSPLAASSFIFNFHNNSDVGQERMRLDASGNLLVGKTTAVGSSTAGHELRSDGLTYHTCAGACIVLNRTGATGSIMAFKINDSTVGTISVTGSATAYNTSSDYRLKENITPVQGAADIVKAMQPVTYTFKSDGSWHDGFLAHELQELHPRAVIGEKDAMKDEEYEVTPAVYEDVVIPAVDAVVDEDGNVTHEAQPERTEQRLVSEAVMGTRSVPDYQGVDYSKLTPILTAALQEALNKIDALEARLTVLEGTV